MSRNLHIRNSILALFLFFNLTLFANINIGNPVNITECFQSTTEGFDLTLNNSNVLDGLDPNLYSVYYFDNQADSNNNTISNAISNPANYSTGTFGLAQVWVNVVEDADETNFDNSTFLLISNQQPIANEPLNANTNTFFQPDVFFIGIDDIENNIYDLTEINSKIIQSQSGSFSIQYFENINDANNNVNPIQNPENFFIDPDDGPQHIINMSARIEFANSDTCFDTVNFDIYVFNPQEDEFNTNDFSVCANPNGTTSVNIEEQVLVDISEITFQVGVNFAIVDEDGTSIAIFENEIEGLEPVNIGISYRLVYPGVTIIDLSDGSIGINQNSLNQLTIFPIASPVIEDIENITSCSSGDEEITFDLTQNDALALGSQTGNFDISYHFTLPEANSGTNSVTDLGFDPTALSLDNFQQFMFLRIENADNPECFAVEFFTLVDAGNITANAPENTEFCSISGETNTIVDLTTLDAQIKGDQTSSNFIIEYFENDTFIDEPSNYSLDNETTTITAVLSLSNVDDCSDEVEFDITLKQTPEIQNLNDLEACSDFDLNTTFNLTENTSEAIGTQDPNEVEVAYFTSLQDAEDNVNSLESQGIDLLNYTASSENETIFIRLQGSDSADCFVVDSFELTSFPVEINQVDNLVNCTESGETSAFFDLSQVEAELLPTTANSTDFTIAYFDENDVEISNPENYQATSNEIITIEVANVNNPTCVETTSFSLLIEVTPEIQNLNDLEACSDFDLNATFNLTENTSVALGTQDSNEVEVAYFTSLQDAEDNVNSLESQGTDLLNYTASSLNETIFIRLQNTNSANCFVVDSFELTSFPVEINEVDEIEECIDAESQTASFNLTDLETTLFGSNQNSTTHAIAFFDENGNEITSSNDFSITSSQSISAQISNLLNPTCFETTSINLIALAEDDPDCTLSINEEAAFEFKTYPNPVTSQLIIESNEPISKIEVFDIKGKKLTTRKGTQIEHVDFSNFPTGVYLLKLEVGNRSQMAKIIKK
ncbi:T9SS type A sorting domain-containing protein [Psychroflexus planctonicus]|uniref:Secretion system C-terminal sorting domain-containing protein n=1 Tax=Psychroflexus planctonicus TaxID=1526575 RepID=A0ABQ1SDH4_9FLAO|nr:T9SS type A sorting domain-containing protein [Psychroflexus planctonicus]GGE29336.1 hypothetical protein GCM10010832_07320 [Psychroflexus planctonicus]